MYLLIERIYLLLFTQLYAPKSIIINHHMTSVWLVCYTLISDRTPRCDKDAGVARRYLNSVTSELRVAKILIYNFYFRVFRGFRGP